jgi:hypothetical protein
MRRQLAFVAVSATAVGYLLRSAAERRLAKLRGLREARPQPRGLRPNEPHQYVPERYWPGSCWCGKPKSHPVHVSTISGGAGR